ncbi:MAG TPA: porin [Xanthobacteraceae bacterium]|nr:porin [Xanthobacteraceae bacterium]
MDYLAIGHQFSQYVKVCSIYGAGFYYMPGTDMCIKIGGWTRLRAVIGDQGGSTTWGPFNGNANNRTVNSFGFNARGYITADAREQTAYGVARGYIAVGISADDYGTRVANTTFSSNRAFVQWAGFTAGLAVSFYDFYSVPAAQYRGGYVPASDTGDGGWEVWGYTAQLGGGLSATIAAEARRDTQIVDASSSTLSVMPGAYGNNAYGGQQAPDVVGNLRVDQAWGSAQVMGAWHNVNPTYYSAAVGGNPSIAGGHPSDSSGFAVGAGLKVNFPTVAPGDYFQSQVNYTQGALRYLFATPNSNWGKVDGANVAYGVLSDCVYGGTVAGGTTTSCQLTSAWGFNASYEHYWAPQWHQSVYGEYYAVNYDSSANTMLCANEGAGAAACNNDWSTWGVGSRLQWDVTKSFYLGVEALYTRLNSATGATASVFPAGSGASGLEGSSSAWTFTLRMHKDFLP